VEILLLLLLLVGAGALLVPGLFKERAMDSPLSTVSDFRRGMTALATSTHDYKPASRHYYMAAPGSGTEPYVRRSSYSSEAERHREEDMVPYPSSRARFEMDARRNRIIAVLLTITLATGICALIPKIRWVIILHLTMLLILAIYIALVMLLPYYDNRG
jgi:hypothetical protein